jgi:hypothetical protein
MPRFIARALASRRPLAVEVERLLRVAKADVRERRLAVQVCANPGSSASAAGVSATPQTPGLLRAEL